MNRLCVLFISYFHARRQFFFVMRLTFTPAVQFVRSAARLRRFVLLFF